MNFRQIVNVVGLVIGFASFYFEVLTPFWGIVFLYGTFHGLKEGKISLFFETRKVDSPILYWLIMLLWASFGLYFLSYVFY